MAKKKAKRGRTAAGKRIGRPPKSAKQREADRLEHNRRARERRAELKRISALARENAEATAREAQNATVDKREFVPTVEDRQRVETLAGLGMRADEIALMVINPATDLPIDDKTLRAHCSRELSVGPVKANSKVAESIYKKAIGNGASAVTAAIWYSKCRMGWRERIAVDVDVKSGVLVAPMAMSPEEWIAAQAALSAAAKEPGTEE